MTKPAAGTAGEKTPLRRVVMASLIGTTIEWYDFFIFAQAAGLIFASLYFGPLNEDNPGLAQLVSRVSRGAPLLRRHDQHNSATIQPTIVLLVEPAFERLRKELNVAADVPQRGAQIMRNAVGKRLQLLVAFA